MLPIAEAFGTLIKDFSQPTIWKDHFEAGTMLFTELIKLTKQSEFAVFIFGKDDFVSGERHVPGRYSVRDNVIFEFGLFLGAIGEQRTFFIPASDLNIPADLRGLIHLTPYNASACETSLTQPEVLAACLQPTAKSFRALIQGRHTPLTPAALQLRNKIHDVASLVAQEAGRIQHQFRFQVITDVVADLADEVKSALTAKKYSKDITLEAAFLVRARELFARSDGILAVSLDRFSTFWLPEDEYNRRLVQRYIHIQPKKGTRRLFVFSDPRCAAQHRHVLDQHYQAYGRGGGVYLCSWAAYRRFLSRSIGEDSRAKRDLIDTYSEKDFAVLNYQNPTTGLQEKFFATLSSTSLEYEPLTSGTQEGIEKLEADLNSAMEISEGSWHGVHEILRWDPVLAAPRDDSHWKRELERMFQSKPPTPGEEEGDVMHFVFFSNKVTDQLPTVITEVMDRLGGMQSRFHGGLVKDVWFGKHTRRLTQLNAVDGVTGGKLITENTFVQTHPYCLIVKLDGAKQLEEYYNHINHSDARKRIQNSFGDKLITQMHAGLANSLAPDIKKEKYQEIENIARLYMIRADYMRDVDIDTLIQGARSRFGM